MKLHSLSRCRGGLRRLNTGSTAAALWEGKDSSVKSFLPFLLDATTPSHRKRGTELWHPLGRKGEFFKDHSFPFWWVPPWHSLSGRVGQFLEAGWNKGVGWLSAIAARWLATVYLARISWAFQPPPFPFALMSKGAAEPRTKQQKVLNSTN